MSQTQTSWQAAVAASLPDGAKVSHKSRSKAPGKASASERQQQLQTEVNDLKRKETELRALLAEVAGSAADALSQRLSEVQLGEAPSGNVHTLVQELSFVQRAKAYAQCLQELQGVLKLLERQLRAVDRAAAAGDLDAFLAAVSEAVASHNTVAENCEKLAQLPAAGLPQLLRQHADSAVGRATSDQEKLVSSLQQVLQRQLGKLGWPPPLATPSVKAVDDAQQPHLVETTGSWQGFESGDQEAIGWLIRLLAALVALQRSVQRASFELGLDGSTDEPPTLWAAEEVAAALTTRLRHHFVGSPTTDRIDRPEWLFETVRRLATRLAPQLAPLAPCLSVHGLQTAYHLPFEFVRALRSGMQGILRQHTLPRLLEAGQPGLWLNFIEKAVAFERQLSSARGIPHARASGEEGPELWRHGSCIAVVCSNEAFRDAWWGAVREEASRQLEDSLALPTAWAPAHLAWGSDSSDDWEDASAPKTTATEPWQAEFWPPQVSEATLSNVTQLAKIAAWLPDDTAADFAKAVPQEILKQLRRHMSSEFKRLEDFREELSDRGVHQAGPMLCCAHHLEHSLREASGQLLLLDPLQGREGEQAPSMLLLEADALGAFKQRGTLHFSKLVIDSFRQATGSYFGKSSLKSFGESFNPEYREGATSLALRNGLDGLHTNLARLSHALDSVLFGDMWKGVAAALNRLVFNALITEALFSPEGAQRLVVDVSEIVGAFARFTNRPAAHFREITEAARLLAADEATASLAARQLRGSADRMADALLPLGIVRLTPQQAAHVLAQRA